MVPNAVLVPLLEQSRMQRTEHVHALREDAPGWNSVSQLRTVANYLCSSLGGLQCQLHTSLGGAFQQKVCRQPPPPAPL